MYDLVFVHLHKLKEFSQNLFLQTKTVLLDTIEYVQNLTVYQRTSMN